MLNQNNCCAPNVFTIFTGDAKTLNMKAVHAETGDPLDLTSCTNISIALPNADGTFTALTLAASQVSITSFPNLGKFSAPISSAVSALLLIAVLQNIDVTFTISGSPFTVRYCQALTVLQT